MEIKDIYELWDRFEGSTALELEVEVGGGRLHLKRETGYASGAGPQRPAVMKGSWPEPADEKMSASRDEEQETNQGAADEKYVTAPLVGTFYRSSEPGQDPFVKEGQKVKKGDRLCIIEAMKLMNEVTAEQDGEIRKICVTDGSLVEYGQTLFVMS